MVGAGVTGLVAALELATSGHDVTLVESSERIGGKLATTEWRGVPLDLGPDAFIARNPAATDLCRRVGLGEELVSPATGTAAIWSRGRLRPFPAGLALGVPVDLVALARSGIVGPAGAARAALDLVLPGPSWAGLTEQARAGGADPTIAEVVVPRLGRAVLSSLVDPLVGGINAGDSAALSFAAAAPMLAMRLGGHPSLIRSLRPAAAPASGPRPPSVFLGLQGGLASLVEALGASCRSSGVTIRLASALDTLRRNPDGTGYLLQPTSGPPLAAERVVLAVPAGAAAGMLAGLDPALALECAAIPYAGVVLVTVSLRAEEVAGRLQGSGVLVPRAPQRQVTALTFVSAKWPRSTPPGELVVRASLGRHGHDDLLELDDDAIIARALREMGEILRFAPPPVETLVKRWPASFPQYVSGHLARVARIDRLVAAHPGLALAGAAYRGIGIPACVEDGRRAAAAVTGEVVPAR